MLAESLAKLVWTEYQRLIVAKSKPGEYRLQDLICQQFVPDQEHCSTIGNNIASSFITAAGSRIFKEPDRAFIELPLHSIDSYRALRGEPSIGKFGMGFYSELIYLIGYEQRRIIIDSRTKDESWTVSLRYKSGSGIIVDYQPNTQRKSLGTTIRVVFDAQPYDTTQVMVLLDRYLSFIPDVQIIVNQKFLNKDFIKPNVTDQVVIKVSNQEMSVEDQATGISSQILFDSLLVPGISSKGIKLATIDSDYQGRLTGYYSYVNQKSMFILVGDIPVMNTQSTGTLIVQMPSNTPLPVSRDDIIWLPEVIKVFLREVQRLLDSLINNVAILLESIRALQSMIDHLWLKDFLDSYLAQLPERGIFLIDVPENLAQIIRDLTKYQIVVVKPEQSRADHLLILENMILNLNLRFQNELFLGKSVLLTKGIFYAGFSRLLFLPEDQVNKLESLVKAHPEESLVLWSGQTRLSPKDLIIDNLFAKTKGLEYTFDFPEELSRDSFKDQLDSLYRLSPRLFDLYVSKTLSYYQQIVSIIQKITAYGGGRRTINSMGFMNIGLSGSSSQQQKLARYLQELMVDSFDYYIRNQVVIIPIFWTWEVIPTDGLQWQLLRMSPSLYSYLAVKDALSNFSYMSPVLPEARIQTLFRYYQSKLDLPFQRTQIIQLVNFRMVPSFQQELRDVAKNISSGITPWTEPTPPASRSYLLSELLERSFAPDFQLSELLGLKSKPKVKPSIQLIQIASIPFNNPTRDTIFTLMSNVPKGDVPYATLRLSGDSLRISVTQDSNLSLKEILSASIPFSSTGPGLGIGLFRLLTAVQRVDYYFTVDDQSWCFIDTPIRSSSGAVIDVERTISPVREGPPRVMAFMLPEYSDGLSQLEAKYLFQEVLPLTRKVGFEGRFYQPVKRFSVTSGNLRGYYIEGQTSWATVSGFPQTELRTLLERLYPEFKATTQGYNEVLTGILLDSAEPITKPSADLQKILYYLLCKKYLNIPADNRYFLDTYLLNTTSKHADQIRKQTGRFNNVLTLKYDLLGIFQKDLDEPTINEVINYMLDNKLIDVPETMRVRNPLTNRLKAKKINLLDVESQAIKRWFSTKITNKPVSVPSGSSEQQRVLIENENLINWWLTEFVQRYWQIIRTLKIPELAVRLDPPKIIVKALNGVAGRYIPAEHRIEISTNMIQTEYLKTDEKDQRKLINDYNNRLYGLIFPASVLIHELYHAIIGQQEGFHPDRSYTIDGQKKTLTFDQGANELYRQVILHGF